MQESIWNRTASLRPREPLSGDRKVDAAVIGGGLAGILTAHFLRAAGLDPDEYTGFYVNIGLDRLVMMRYGVDDVRLFHSADLRFLKQFH